MKPNDGASGGEGVSAGTSSLARPLFNDQGYWSEDGSESGENPFAKKISVSQCFAHGKCCFFALMLCSVVVCSHLLVQTIVVAVAGGVGFWLFCIQRSFETVLGTRSENWDYTNVAF